MKMNYQAIKDALDGEVFGSAVGEDGESILLQAERVGDCRAGSPGYDGPLEDSEVVYTAMWESRRTDNVVWYVKHWYHEDGTVEETFEYEEVL